MKPKSLERVTIKFLENTNLSLIEKLCQEHNLEVMFPGSTDEFSRIYCVDLPPTKAKNLAIRLRREYGNKTEYVERGRLSSSEGYYRP